MADDAPSRGRCRLQRLLLRIYAISTLLALPAVLNPQLAALKLRGIMGLKEPVTPLSLYMMAGGSAVYLGQGALMWMLSTDVVRYQPLIRFIAWVFIACGPLFLWIDAHAGLPAWWMMMDSTGSLLAGLALTWACYSRGAGGTSG